MTTSYGPQTAQMNEKLLQKSSLDLTLTQHLCDEDPESQKVRPHFKIEPLQAWYYCISLNFCTLVILLKINLASNDELETISKGFTKLKTPLSLHGFQFLALDTIVGYVVQFVDYLLITRRNYLVHTIRRNLNFLHL
jgi:hypothetical protein